MTLNRLSDSLQCVIIIERQKVLIFQDNLLGKLPYPTAQADFSSKSSLPDSNRGTPDLKSPTLPNELLLLLI